MRKAFNFLMLLLCASGVAEEKTVCLALVVKNDEATIWRCLDSVKEIVDCVSVCDLGSTDRTREFIENFLQETGIPGKIHQRETETEGMVALAAQKTLKSFGFPLEDSYLFLLKPDQFLETESTLPKETLIHDFYLVVERAPLLSCFHYQPNLFRASLPHKSVDARRAVEYVHPVGTASKLRTMIVGDQPWPRKEGEEESAAKEAEAAARTRQLTRNVELFTTALKEDPENTRLLFFLAQSLKSLQRYDEALSLYQRRMAIAAGDPEEIWFSKYMMGECHEEMGSWTDALYWYLEAYQYNSHRGESIKKIATHYRLQGENDLAYIFAKHGLHIPPKEHLLFPLNPVHDYQFDEELSVAAYYTRFKEEGYDASSDLLLRKTTPYHVKEQGYRNLLFYVKNLKARFEPLLFPLPLVNADKGDERYHPMNPSIQKTADGYQVIGRAVNYTQTGAKHFHTNDPQGIFRTKNFLLHYDQKFQKLSQREIVENLPREHNHSFLVQGLEDCRLVCWNGETWFSCTCFDSNPTGAIQIALCKLDGRCATTPEIRVEQLTPMLGPDPNRIEKNWLPFLKDGKLQFIYSCDPFVVYEPDAVTGECKKVFSYEPEHDFSRFRGSAAPVPFEGGHLMIVHEIVQLPDYTRNYLHRFVWLDPDFKIRKTSKPFTFFHNGVEFCGSMTLDHEGKQFILPVGVEDHDAFLCFVDVAEVRSMLHPLPTLYPSF